MCLLDRPRCTHPHTSITFKVTFYWCTNRKMQNRPSSVRRWNLSNVKGHIWDVITKRVCARVSSAASCLCASGCLCSCACCSLACFGVGGVVEPSAANLLSTPGSWNAVFMCVRVCVCCVRGCGWSVTSISVSLQIDYQTDSIPAFLSLELKKKKN